MLYITEVDINDDTNKGVTEKIRGQIYAFDKAGLNCSYYRLKSEENNNSIIDMVKRRLPYINIHKHWHLDDELISHDNIYIRQYVPIDDYIVRFFNNLKRKNPKCRIVWELPTYPYDDELRGEWRKKPFLWRDKYNRVKLKLFVDRIATLTNDKRIFGIPTLHIQNGIDIQKYKVRKVGNNINTINMIAVSKCIFWHGYDRLFLGLYDYYKNGGKRNVVVHFVGDGMELPKYKKMVKKYNLNNHVVFYGIKIGEELDEIYDSCNIGVGSLGCYRKGMNETAELKSRDYLAKGIPFVTSVKILDIPREGENNIYLRVPNNDSPLDINSVIDFYDRIYAEGADKVNTRLRKFAKEHFSMEVAMKEVIDFFKETNKNS